MLHQEITYVWEDGSKATLAMDSLTQADRSPIRVIEGDPSKFDRPGRPTITELTMRPGMFSPEPHLYGAVDATWHAEGFLTGDCYSTPV